MSHLVSIAVARGRKNEHKIPRDGTQLKRLYDLLKANPGQFVDDLGVGASGYLAQLRDIYGLDIRCFPLGIGKHGSRWCLVGEFIGGRYFDYLAERYK